MKPLFYLLEKQTDELAGELWKAEPKLLNILSSGSNEDSRDALFEYLNLVERKLCSVRANKDSILHTLQRNNAKHCSRVLKNLIRTEYEQASGSSVLRNLISLSKKEYTGISQGFMCEMIALFSGLNGKSRLYSSKPPAFLKYDGRKAAIMRSDFLDRHSKKMESYFEEYGRGLDPEISEHRKKAKERIMGYFKASESDWVNYRWHLSNTIRDLKTLEKLADLSEEEKEGVRLAEKIKIPFQITPYYLSLFVSHHKNDFSRAIRAQVLPSLAYCKGVIESEKKGESLDFMGEGSTSPVDCITRRYPEIVILKPYNSCPQICVYCQRNWEIRNMCEGNITKEKIKHAIEWISHHKSIKEVLVTGGDPFTLPDDFIDWILGELSKIRHIRRIRVGTRVFLTVPCRITPELVAILKKYLEPGKRDICLVTHVEHSAELTNDVLKACNLVRNAGIRMYNQQVFTYFNSRKFETCLLRRELKQFGIDPYYAFNTKGKEETVDFRVPVARILQERKEEARLMPGIERTDEPVFNVPRLGKSHLRAWQDHELIMVLPDGRRVYRFYPWESMLELVEPYDYIDVPIYDYLKRLNDDGENLEEYKTIWYYF